MYYVYTECIHSSNEIPTLWKLLDWQKYTFSDMNLEYFSIYQTPSSLCILREKQDKNHVKHPIFQLYVSIRKSKCYQCKLYLWTAIHFAAGFPTKNLSTSDFCYLQKIILFATLSLREGLSFWRNF